MSKWVPSYRKDPSLLNGQKEWGWEKAQLTFRAPPPLPPEGGGGPGGCSGSQCVARRSRQHPPSPTSMALERRCRSWERVKGQWPRKSLPRWSRSWKRKWLSLMGPCLLRRKMMRIWQLSFSSVAINELHGYCQWVAWGCGGLVFRWFPGGTWRRKWQPMPVFLPGESHEQRRPGRLQSMGCKSWTQLSKWTTWWYWTD